jgi:parvulin-like peptidyl-prolyl isomerase
MKTIDNVLDLSDIKLTKIEKATERQIIDYLKYSRQYIKLATEVESNNVLQNIGKQLNIYISEDEIQEFGDNFRKENRLYGESETLDWLSTQRIDAEDWSKGIYIQILIQKIKESVVGASVDSYYMSNRNSCRRVALSQILVSDLTTAIKIVESIRNKNESFCALALEFSQGKQSKENGGFAGIKFVAELLPEISTAIEQADIGSVLDPVQSRLGYHILRVEKWFPPALNEIRDSLIDYLFQSWISDRVKESQDR